jgi:Ni/Co efflux regulator RcnB
MRKLIFTCIAATLVAAPMTTIVKAEDTTVIKRDRDGEGDKTVIKRDRDRDGEGDKTVIKKREELNVLPVPHTEEKTIIKKERD